MTYFLFALTTKRPKAICPIHEIGFVNIGFAPLSGLELAQTFPERSMKFAYQKIKSFSQYRGQRDYKEKFKPKWSDKFLIYNHDYDLLQAPMVLSKIIRL